MTRQGNLKDHNQNKVMPNTTSAAVYDAARQQALSASLLCLVEKNALGYPDFSTVVAYPAGKIVFYDRRLWIFNVNHAAGSWAPEEVDEVGVKDIVEVAFNTLWDALLDGNLVPALAETLAAWADQKALSTEAKWQEPVRTTGGDIPLETSEGAKLESIIPKQDWTAKLLFNGAYNMLKAAVWGNANSQPLVGGLFEGGCYFLVPELTLGQFGDASENNGLLFTGSDGSNLNPVVYYKPLGATAPAGLTDGSAVTPATVSYDGKTYKAFETPTVNGVKQGAGWFIVTFPSDTAITDICAHIAWEDWYDKYVGLDEEDDPAEEDYNPEAALGILTLEGFLALIHADKVLRCISEEVCDRVEFTETQAKGYKLVDLKVTVPADWTNVQDGDNYIHTADVGSAMKNGGSAILLDGTAVEVNGTLVSFVDQESAVAGDKLTIKYERAAEEVITKAYSDSVFAGSNIDASTGKININDCSIEAWVGAVGVAEYSALYAQNTVDKLGMIAQVDFRKLLETVEDQEVELDDLNRSIIEERAKDPDMKFGQPRLLIMHGSGAPAAANVPDNWIDFANGGYNWIGKPAFVGQQILNVDVTTSGTTNLWIGYQKSDYTLDWRACGKA